MLRKATDLQSLQKQQPRYEITASLLNAWQYIMDGVAKVREAEYDEISLEEKKENKYEELKAAFIETLKRVKTPTTEAQQRGIDFENKVCSGKDEVFSPIVKDGAFQVRITKKVEVDDYPILLVGVLDVLKAGYVLDIKNTSYYKYPKFKTSHQHPMYFELAGVNHFTYLIHTDDNEYYTESYEKQNCENIYKVISTFIDWLKGNDLLEIWMQCWGKYDY